MLKKSFMLLCIAFVLSGCQGLDNTIPDSKVPDRKEVHTVMQRNIEKLLRKNMPYRNYLMILCPDTLT